MTIKREIKSIDEMIKCCGHFYVADASINVNNGYNCNHPDVDDSELVDGKCIGKCSAFNCPIAYAANKNDFRNPDIDNCGWTDFIEGEFVVFESEVSSSISSK